MTYRLIASLFCGVLVSLASLSAQDRTPTADSVKELAKSFATEREKAVTQKFPPVSLERADTMAKKAEEATKKENFRDATKFYRDARWQIPFISSGLPDHVYRSFGVNRMRHGDWVNAIALSPDESKLVSASRDGSVRIWDLSNGREVRIYREHPGSDRGVTSVDWSKDGKFIASSSGKEIHLWEADTGKRLQTLTGHTNYVNAVSIRSDNKAVASGSDDRTVRVWNVEDGKEVVNLGDQGSTVYTVRYSPNGKLIASGNADGNFNVWKPDNNPVATRNVLGTNAHAGGTIQILFSSDGKYLFTCGIDRTARMHGAPGPAGEQANGMGTRLKQFDVSGGGHTQSVTALAISPDGKTLVTGSIDKSIRVWDVATAKVLRTLQGHAEEVTSLIFSKDGTQLYSAAKDQSIRVWNLDPTDSHRNFDDHKQAVWSATFSPSGKLIASAGADRSVILREAGSGKILKTLTGHKGSVTALAFSPDETLLVSSAGDQLLKLWDVKTGELVRDFKGHTSAIMAVAFSPDGKKLLSGGADKTAILWNVADAKILHTLKDLRTAVSALAIRKDGNQAAIGGADGSLRIFDIKDTPKEVGIVSAHLSGVGALAYSADGSRLVTCGGDKIIKLWTTVDNGPPQMRAELKGHSNSISSVAFSPDDRLLVSGGGDQIVRVWNLADNSEMRSLRGHTDWISSVMFAPDSRNILTAAVDKSVRIWELSMEDTAPPAGHLRALNAIAISADGKWIASGSDDRMIKVWNVTTGAEAFTLTGHTGKVLSVCFDPSGKRLLSGGEDRRLRFWDLDTKKEIRSIETDDVNVLTFTPKGDKLLGWFIRPGTGDLKTNTISAMDPEGKPLYSVVEKEKNVTCLSFSQDGEIAAIGSPDGVVRIWNLQKNERVLPKGDLPAHAGELVDLSLSPDKKKLVTGDNNGEIKIWDLAEPKVLKTFKAYEKSNLAGIFCSPDGKSFVSYSGKGEVRLWKLENAELLRSWDLPTTVRNIIFSSDGKYLITANGDTTITMLELP